jgi:hypothetical protein
MTQPIDRRTTLVRLAVLAGAPVIIAGTHSDPWELTHPGMVLGAYAEEEMEDAVAALEDKGRPADRGNTRDYPITTLVASTLDGRVDLIENGRVG